MSVEQDFEIERAAQAQQVAHEDQSINGILEQLSSEYGFADRLEELAEISETLHRSGTTQLDDHDFSITRDPEGGYALHDKRQAAA